MDYRIGDLTLRPRRQLTSGDRALPIGRKALDLLSVLAEARGAVVTKDELMAAVWPGVIVEENAIQVHVAALRRAMGAAADRLTTVRSLGYRLDAAPCRAAVDPRAAEPAPLIAVLPFEHSAFGAAGLEHLADGIAEEVLNAIAKNQGVRVIARTSSFHLRGEARRPRAVADQLGATHLLDGSIRRQANRIRIGAQLVATSDETVLWAERFDGKLVDLFSLEEAIADAVAAALQLKVARAAPKIAVNPQAYDSYLHGRRLAGAIETRRQCIIAYERAVAITPEFADAWSALALARALAARWDERTEPFAVQSGRARDAADRALALDPTAASAQLALGVLEPFGCYVATEHHFARALELAPNDPEALRQSANLAYTVGRVAEAFALAQRAATIDPLNAITAQNHAALLYEVGRTGESLAAYANARQRWPEIGWFLSDPLFLSAIAGDWPAVDELLAEPERDDKLVQSARFGVKMLRDPDARAQGDIVASAERDLSRSGRVNLSTLVFMHALGMDNEAYGLISRADFSHLFRPEGEGHDTLGFLPGIIFGSNCHGFRCDRRFVELCLKLGLARYWFDTDRWPDCADDLVGHYDIRAEVKKALG